MKIKWALRITTLLQEHYPGTRVYCIMYHYIITIITLYPGTLDIIYFIILSVWIKLYFYTFYISKCFFYSSRMFVLYNCLLATIL